MKQKIFTTVLTSTLLLIPLTSRALTVTPNDPHFDTQYYIQQTQVDKAWSYSVGNENIVIAVIDAGVDLDHPDLKDNIWINKDEIPNNNKDDDNNGYVDDTQGWNFVENTPDPNPQFIAYNTEGASHGTLVAGIIAASGNNNEGIAGVSWNSKIMPLRALNSRGEGNIADAINAINYAVNNQADIINLSFVGPSFTNEFKQAIKNAYRKGVVLVAAVGNDAVANASLIGGDLDMQPVYPACFRTTFEDYVIGVGAVNKNNVKADFSNYGLTCLDINVPGVDIVSTQTINLSRGSPFTAEYSGYWNGSSFAAPQIAGIAALIKSINPKFRNNQIASFISDTADKIDSVNANFAGKLGAGLLNAQRALKAAAPINLQPSNPVEVINLQKNNKALWVTDTVPASMQARSLSTISVTFKNKGLIIWNPNFLKLQITDFLGKESTFLPNEFSYQGTSDILPSQIVKFDFKPKAPSNSGTYNLKFELVYKNQPIKGGALYKTIVVASTHQAVLTNINAPIAVSSNWGQIATIIKITNNSFSSWKKNETVLQLEVSDKNIFLGGNLNLKQNIQPGATATFNPILHFRDAEKGLQYYTLGLKINDQVIDIEAGARVVRID